jgi:outer membrane cobalamin receptor
MLRDEFDSLGLANGRYDIDLTQHSLISHRPDSSGTWMLGVERIDQTAHQMGLGAEQGTYRQTGYFASRTHKFQLPHIAYPTLLNLNMRYDDHNQYQTYLSKQVGVKQFWAKEGYLAVNIGDRQRSPNLFERFSAYSSGVVSPETINSKEISMGWKDYSLTYFDDEINNLIDYLYPSGYTNVSGVSHISGWEWKVKQAFSPIDSELSASYTVLDAKNKDGKTLAQRPDDSGSLSWSYFGLPRTTLVLQAQHTGARYYSVGQTGLPTGNFWLWHANASYQWNKEVRLFAKGVNLADERIVQGDGFSNTYYAYSPRTFLAGVEYRF